MTKIDVVSGFLGAGKTTLIKKLLKEALDGSKTVLIENEFGEIGIDGGFLKEAGIEIKEMNSGCICCSLVGDFGTSLKEVISTYAPERILIEPSGVGKLSDVLKAVENVAGDLDVEINSAVAVVDASKCKMYMKNFGEFFSNQIEYAGTIILSRTDKVDQAKLNACVEMIRKSEMIIFNRCDGIKDLNVYKRNIKAVNPSADVIFEDSNGEIDEIFEEDLPYDLNQDPIVLDNQGYGIWYLDSMDHLERYEGKNIQFLAMVLKPEEYPDGYFVPGRMAMTCCAEDMAFLGYACEFAGTKDLKQKEWVKVTAKVAREYFADYKGEGPVLHAISVEKAKAPKDPVISFN